MQSLYEVYQPVEVLIDNEQLVKIRQSADPVAVGKVFGVLRGHTDAV